MIAVTPVCVLWIPYLFASATAMKNAAKIDSRSLVKPAAYVSTPMWAEIKSWIGPEAIKLFSAIGRRKIEPIMMTGISAIMPSLIAWSQLFFSTQLATGIMYFISLS